MEKSENSTGSLPNSQNILKIHAIVIKFLKNPINGRRLVYGRRFAKHTGQRASDAFPVGGRLVDVKERSTMYKANYNLTFHIEKDWSMSFKKNGRYPDKIVETVLSKYDSVDIDLPITNFGKYAKYAKYAPDESEYFTFYDTKGVIQ